MHICKECGSQFKGYGNNPNKYCSRSCYAKAQTRLSGYETSNFKGDKAGYNAIHAWMRLHYGKPSQCETCGTTQAKNYHWANLSGLYIRDRSDWKRLCQSCHFKMDRIGYRSWETRKGVLSL